MVRLYEHGSSLSGLAGRGRPVLTQLYKARLMDCLSNGCSFPGATATQFSCCRPNIGQLADNALTGTTARLKRSMRPELEPASEPPKGAAGAQKEARR